ncbi:CPBP family intramembrane metalloprotease [Leptobacterium flavescens]|uniref:CPBP family intramembrane metalloprotease n=1 Tax=Leptobacterium flavescens TaxID=472055 RepID=A0A6P0UNI6_9FLAO|nr:CPBP family glutamic-type intramembrane protease [Leptobacterium flavescens]NER14735.1 CPBP family intramembrane metalloprotease [Leptobacterium flavescens]
MKKSLKIIVIVLIGFLSFELISEYYFSPLLKYIDGFIGQRIISFFFTYLIVGLPVIIALFFLHPPKEIIKSMGLIQKPGRGVFIAFLFTLPMLIGYSFFFKINPELTLQRFFISCVFAAFFEEVFFRAFLVGQIFRYTKLGFVPTILFGSLIFGLGHLYQSNDPSTMLGIFMITALGAAIFAWLFIEWNYNIWVAIGLHFFMNFYWELFTDEQNALGGLTANIFRFSTIFVAIAGTIIYKRRNKLNYLINRNTLWINRTSHEK